MTCITSARRPGDPGITRRASHQHNPAIRNDPLRHGGLPATTSPSTAPAISTVPACSRIINGLTVSNQGCLRFVATRSLASKDVTARYRRGPLRIVVKACRRCINGQAACPRYPGKHLRRRVKSRAARAYPTGTGSLPRKGLANVADHRLDGSGYPRGLSGAALSPRCADNHIEHIYIRTGCSSRAEASLHAIQQGLLASRARGKEPALESAASTDRHQADSGGERYRGGRGNGGTHPCGQPGQRCILKCVSQKHKRKEARERSRPRRVDPHQAAGPSRKDLFRPVPRGRSGHPDDEGEYRPPSPRVPAAPRSGAVRERRAQATHPARKQPVLIATGPNEVWPGITKLAGPLRGVYYHFVRDRLVYSPAAPRIPGARHGLGSWPDSGTSCTRLKGRHQRAAVYVVRRGGRGTIPDVASEIGPTLRVGSGGPQIACRPEGQRRLRPAQRPAAV